VSVSVLYFAALRDLSGIAEEQVALENPGQDVAALMRLLQERHGSLRGRLDGVRVAVNEEFVDTSTRLAGGEVVALIPPVSGG
jgi:molybdopterin converting factor subunit 1